jgi:hypothetical protein
MPHAYQPHIPPSDRLTPTTPAASPETSREAQPQPPVPVPVAVWPTPCTAPVRPSDPAPAGASGRVWMVPPLLAQQLIAVYTTPGGTVLAVGGSSRTVARTAVRLDRRPPARGRDRRAAAGSVDLLIITPPALDLPIGTAGSAGSGAGGGGWRRWPHLLAPTGILAVVLPPARAPGDPAAVVAVAVGSGLSYLQHAVAVLWPLHDDHLDPPTHPDRVEPGRGGLPAAHADVLLFTPGLSPEPEEDPEPGTEPGTDPDGRAASRPAMDFGHEGETR